MIAKIAALMMGVTALATPVQQQSTDVVIRAGEYENKPGKRIYVDQNFDVPEGIELRKDEDGYFISEWDINVKLATKLAGYLTAYGINTELQIAEDKSEDLNSAGRIARSKNPKIYLSIHHNYFQNDSTGYIYIYTSIPSGFKVGDTGNFKGTLSSYSGILQIGTLNASEKSSSSLMMNYHI